VHKRTQLSQSPKRQASLQSKPCEQPDQCGTKNGLKAQVRAEARRHLDRCSGRLAQRPSPPKARFSGLSSGLRSKGACRVGIALVVLACSIGFPAAAEGQWTRFRGPNGTGVAASASVPIEFGPEKNVAWKTPLPPGHSSPVLTSHRIFLTAHTDDKNNYKLLVLCLDRKSGALLWQREVPRVQQGRLQNVNGPASPSPVTDGANVYVFFQDFGMIAFDANGVEKWRRRMGPFNMFYGFGASPILVDDMLILAVDQDVDSHMIAVDKNTGKTRWRVARPGVISGYSTPTMYEPKNGPKQIIVPESFQLSSYSAADGKRLWWVRGLACEMKSVASIDEEYLYINGWGFPQNQPGQHVATVPFAEGRRRYDTNNDGVIAKEEIAGDGPMDRVLSPKGGFDAFDLDRNGRLDAKEWEVFRMMMASENGLLAIKLGGQGDMTSSAIRWRYQRPVPQVPSTLLHQGVLFMVNDSGILTSFDPATGSVLKQGRLKGAIDKYFASPVGSGGTVWLISQDGTVSVVSAKGDWEVLAVNTLGDEVFATPAIADGTLYVRTRNALYCFSQGASPGGNWSYWRRPRDERHPASGPPGRSGLRDERVQRPQTHGDSAWPGGGPDRLGCHKLYVLTDTGMVSCYNARTGEAYYQQVRLPKTYSFKSSPVGANGKLYLASENEDVIVLRMGETFEVLATNTMPDQVFIATPAITGGEIFLRSKTGLYCIRGSY